MSIDFSQNRPHRSQQPRSASANFVGRIAGQSALLLAGFATAQGASFLRNALIGRYLSPTDFGIAASITLALQLVEILSDLGADRLIVRSEDGDTPAMMATVHAVLLTRGFLTAALLYTVAAPLTAFLRITESLWAFEIIALVPAIKGFMHIDCRRRQRHLDNRPFLLVDSATQVAALLLAIPIITLTESYAAIVWIMLFQSVLAVTTSHLVATRPYQISLDTSILKRLILFGYPILLSAFPLVAVYQGERLLVGRMFGMGELAAYSAAFMITMVPSLIAAKIGQAVMLPLLSAVQKQRRIFAQRFQVMCEIAVAAAAGYLMLFIVAGDKILTLTFGPNYSDMGALLTCFALMWALRIVQAVPGMAMMAKGKTGPLLSSPKLVRRSCCLCCQLYRSNAGYSRSVFR